MLAGGASPASHHLDVHRDAGEHAARHVEELGHPALEHEAVEGAAQHRVGPGPEHDGLGSHGVGDGDDRQDRRPPPRRPLADPLDGLGHGPVGQARPEHHEGRPLAGDGVEELARGGHLLHELGAALQEAHLEPQLAPVEPGDQDAPLGRRQLTTLWRLRRKRKARWKRSGRIVFRPSREGTRS